MIQRVDSTYRGKPTHHYRIDGTRVDGVTTLISNGVPKPALLPWGIRSVAEYAADNLDQLITMQPMGRQAIVEALKQAPYTDRDTAAKRGTEVHSYAEQLVHGHPVTPPDELRGHVEHAARFLDEWAVEPVAVEVVVGSRQWVYAGTADLVADIRGAGRCLIDYKTSRSGIFGETALQLAAYANAEVYLDERVHDVRSGKAIERPVTGLRIERALGVWVRADGYDVVPVDITESTFKLFLHAAYVARRAKTLRGLIGPPIPSPDLTAWTNTPQEKTS